MNKKAFTMIELIFVIIILGVLAAVAIPKFVGVSNQAKITTCKGYYGTLSRTIAPVIWSDMQANDINASEAFTFASLSKQLDFVDPICGTSAQIIAGGVDGTDYNISIPKEGDFTVVATKVTDMSAPSWKLIKN